jgi:hypothetical protein
MSDNLISRKELWEEIVRLEELARRRVLDTPISSPYYQRYSTQLDERTNLKHIIADAKTAYDVDKVVEALEIKSIPCKEKGKCIWIEENQLGCEECVKRKAVKIVKGGGVDE